MLWNIINWPKSSDTHYKISSELEEQEPLESVEKLKEPLTMNSHKKVSLPHRKVYFTQPMPMYKRKKNAEENPEEIINLLKKNKRI